jgi:hypothetical protein
VNARSTRALAAGAVVAVAYVASTVVWGHQSPLARRPLLDGLPPPINYRWVEPPPELAPTNEPPGTETFRVPLGSDGSLSNVITTSDAQVSLILPEGSFGAAGGQRSVEVTIEPLASSAAAPAGRPFEIVGNVYRLDAAYLPSTDPAPLSADAGARAVLIYPLTFGDHGTHSVLVSDRGRMWHDVESTDFIGIQQVDGPIETLAYVAVGTDRSAVSPTTPPSTGSRGSPTATIVIVAGLVLLMGALAWALLGGANRRSTGSARGSRRGSRTRSR